MLLGVACSGPALAASYTYQTVNYLGGGQTYFFGANNLGVAVGVAYDINGNLFPISYDINRQLVTVVSAPPSACQSNPLGINDLGVMVGGVFSDDCSTESAYIQDKDGQATVFSNPGWSNSEARAVSDVGLVTGFSYTSDYSSMVGFIYDPKTNAFINFLPSSGTQAQGINVAGQVVGNVYLLANAAYPGSPEGYYGFLRDPDGSITLFRVNGTDTMARGINDFGVITGISAYIGVGCDCNQGFVVTLARSPKRESLRYQSVTVKPSALLNSGQWNTEPEAISDFGVIVGVTAPKGFPTIQGFVGLPK